MLARPVARSAGRAISPREPDIYLKFFTSLTPLPVPELQDAVLAALDSTPVDRPTLNATSVLVSYQDRPDERI